VAATAVTTEAQPLTAQAQGDPGWIAAGGAREAEGEGHAHREGQGRQQGQRDDHLGDLGEGYGPGEEGRKGQGVGGDQGDHRGDRERDG
jgi:hypothetical protein